MSPKTLLKIMFAAILLTLLIYTTYASTQQPILEWRGASRGPDRYWTLATLFDAYFAFLTFYVWLFYKEQSWLARIGWFIAIMALGNMAIASYMLLQLFRLRPEQPVADILLARHR